MEKEKLTIFGSKSVTNTGRNGSVLELGSNFKGLRLLGMIDLLVTNESPEIDR